MNERDRIAHHFAPLTKGESGAFFLTDDAAALTPPAGNQLILTTDSVIQGIHVLCDAMAAQYAIKLMRRNLSDLAAMGATPWRYSLNLHTPRNLNEHWFSDFAVALRGEQKRYAITLIGGDSTSGGDIIHTTMTCIGLTDAAPLRRNGAQVGDDVYVSGTIGDAALALIAMKQPFPPPMALLGRYNAPEPRLALGQALRGVATATIDISDGLIADAAQIATASEISIAIEKTLVPLSPDVQRMLQQKNSLWQSVVTGGDDYELCFTANSSARDTIQKLSETLALPLTRIGSVAAGSGVTFLDESGTPMPLKSMGWSH